MGGSSPLTRGKRPAGEPVPRPERLIPAHAGKTDGLSLGSVHGPAHPRSRGENRMLADAQVFAVGSSPLTRGKRTVDERGADLLRLIPAHAGKTLAVPLVETIQRAHPRSRGENGRHSTPIVRILGSSPLTRGKRWPQIAHEVPHGLIPAHAGKTAHARRRGGPHTAHPRSRGENDVVRTVLRRLFGSSPLTRGKLIGEAAPEDGGRLIPAHAGKT